MSVNNRLQLYREKLNDWTIGDVIGHGSGGRASVYRLFRRRFDFEERDVLKVVNIIEDDIGLDEMSEDYRRNYLEQEQCAVEKALNEVKLMRTLYNCNNIVTYQWFDFVAVRNDDYTATDLLIRMHEYEPLNNLVRKRNLSQKEIVGIGIDVCTALEGCFENRIIHRDIKPDNIFFDGRKYLLGDFGISRILEDGAMAQTSKGTPPYASPEQFSPEKNGGYDNRVDIYSLGLTLYVLANNGRLPFADVAHSINEALMKRLSGVPLPPIEGIYAEFNRIILKACAFDRNERYRNPTDMKDDLVDLMRYIKKSQDDNYAGKFVVADGGYTTGPLSKECHTVSGLTIPGINTTGPLSKEYHTTGPLLGDWWK